MVLAQRMVVALCALVLALLITTTSSFAHPGNTDSQGGHTCRTNCERWGLRYGEYHFHGRPAPAPNRPPVQAPPAPPSSSSGLSDAIGTFFYNGGILVLIGVWWLISRNKNR